MQMHEDVLVIRTWRGPVVLFGPGLALPTRAVRAIRAYLALVSVPIVTLKALIAVAGTDTARFADGRIAFFA